MTNSYIAHYLTRFLDAHGPSHIYTPIMSSDDNIFVCSKLSCQSCVFNPSNPGKCPFYRRSLGGGRVPITFLPYLQQRYPELFI